MQFRRTKEQLAFPRNRVSANTVGAHAINNERRV